MQLGLIYCECVAPALASPPKSAWPDSHFHPSALGCGRAVWISGSRQLASAEFCRAGYPHSNPGGDPSASVVRVRRVSHGGIGAWSLHHVSHCPKGGVGVFREEIQEEQIFEIPEVLPQVGHGNPARFRGDSLAFADEHVFRGSRCFRFPPQTISYRCNAGARYSIFLHRLPGWTLWAAFPARAAASSAILGMAARLCSTDCGVYRGWGRGQPLGGNFNE